ncbi:MAG: hypothetical protein E7197_04645 [Anaerovibrio sp.]|uniref:hypothetical protein n=1 Tax=Anaerovibrio sp. TaxID=1872532 RepID=UPI0025BAB8A8|nr:hypothetical protein [Anaerovibrio sp.]MBE6099323.1 hypothetical protein [Anaerovibrio sp.]
MNEQEKLQHELIKNSLKLAVMTNPTLTSYQKQCAVDEIDKAATKADWIYEMMKQCGYIK